MAGIYVSEDVGAEDAVAPPSSSLLTMSSMSFWMSWESMERFFMLTDSAEQAGDVMSSELDGGGESSLARFFFCESSSFANEMLSIVPKCETAMTWSAMLSM